jgi:hypothetical protein
MKKSVVKSSLAFIVIVGVVLTVIVLLSRYSKPGPSMPSFSFLGDRKPAYRCIKSHLGNDITQDFYSFEADFDDVFPDANKELLALGFVDKTRPISEQWHRNYLLLKGPYEKIRVTFYKRQKLGVYSTPDSSDYSSPDRHAFHVRDGWTSVMVSVEIVPWRIRFYSVLSRIFYIFRS